MHIKPLPQINTDMFSYLDGTFTAELSTLDNFLPSCFQLISQRTGDAVKMTVLAKHLNREGEITHWEYKPRDPDESRFKSLIVFND